MFGQCHFGNFGPFLQLLGGRLLDSYILVNIYLLGPAFCVCVWVLVKGLKLETTLISLFHAERLARSTSSS